MNSTYPEYFEHIQQYSGELGKAVPKVMGAFTRLQSAALSQGALTSKAKELISLGIAICVRCNGCIAFHVHDALQAGATREEIAETIGVAILMGGGPSMVYGCEAFEALEQFEREPAVQVA